MNAVRKLRLVGIVEGASFLVLLLIAMPLKYLLDLPLAVRIVGAIHGILFLWFVSQLLRAHFECGWPLKRSAKVFIAALLPFGFVWIEKDLQSEIAAATLGTLPDPAS